LIKNEFYDQIEALYQQQPTLDEIKKLLGRARAKKGIFEGDLVNGELEIGQIAGLINEVKSVNRVFEEILKEFNDSKVLINRF